MRPNPLCQPLSTLFIQPSHQLKPFLYDGPTINLCHCPEPIFFVPDITCSHPHSYTAYISHRTIKTRPPSHDSKVDFDSWWIWLSVYPEEEDRSRTMTIRLDGWDHRRRKGLTCGTVGWKESTRVAQGVGTHLNLLFAKLTKQTPNQEGSFGFETSRLYDGTFSLSWQEWKLNI